MNYHVEFQGKILKNMDFIKYLVSYVFFWTTVYIRNDQFIVNEASKFFMINFDFALREDSAETL